jgi:hypothetical protein
MFPSGYYTNFTFEDYLYAKYVFDTKYFYYTQFHYVDPRWRNVQIIRTARMRPWPTRNSEWTVFHSFFFDNNSTSLRTINRWSDQSINPSININQLTARQAEVVLRNFLRYTIKTNSIEQLYPYLRSCGLTIEQIRQKEYNSIKLIMGKAMTNTCNKIFRFSQNWPTEYKSLTTLEYMLRNVNTSLGEFINEFVNEIEEAPKVAFFCRHFPMLRNDSRIRFPRNYRRNYMFQVRDIQQ